MKRQKAAQHKAVKNHSGIMQTRNQDKELQWWDGGSEEKVVCTLIVYIYCLRCSRQGWALFFYGKYSFLGLCHCLWYFRVFLTIVVILGTHVISTMHIRKAKLKFLLSVAMMPLLFHNWYLGSFSQSHSLLKPALQWGLPNSWWLLYEVSRSLCPHNPQLFHGAGKFGRVMPWE